AAFSAGRGIGVANCRGVRGNRLEVGSVHAVVQALPAANNGLRTTGAGLLPSRNFCRNLARQETLRFFPPAAVTRLVTGHVETDVDRDFYSARMKVARENQRTLFSLGS